MSTVTVAEALPIKPFGVEGEFFSTHDQICPAIALLEIEHKKLRLGKSSKNEGGRS
jgi:hypothetical protein